MQSLVQLHGRFRPWGDGHAKRLRFGGGGIPLRRAYWTEDTSEERSAGCVGKELHTPVGGVSRVSGRTFSGLVASLCVPKVPLFREWESATR